MPLPPVKAFKTFRQKRGWDYDQDSGAFNHLTELYLISAKGDAAAKLFEIGFFFHAPEETREFCAGGKEIGVWTDQDGRSWTVSRQTHSVALFITFLPAGDVLSDMIDFKAALEFLKGKGVFNGHAVPECG